METNALLNLSVTQLKRAAAIKEQIDTLNDELARVLAGEIPVPLRKTPGSASFKRQISAAGRARIAAAARARWAKVRATKGATVNHSPAKGKRTMSAAAKAKIAAAAKARWARAKAAGKSHL